MCIFWKIRQRKLNIDDFGDPLSGGPPLHASEDPIAVRVVLADTLESAAEGDPISPPPSGTGYEVDEEAPLLHQREVNPDSKSVRGWSAWFRR